MSFSAVMDEVVPEFDVPTRPVTPIDATNTSDNNGRKLYYSESVNRELNKLSKDLSGLCENTIFSSKADRMPPAFGGDGGRFSYEFRRPSEDPANETLHGYQVSQARYTLVANVPPLQHSPAPPNDQVCLSYRSLLVSGSGSKPLLKMAALQQLQQQQPGISAVHAPQFAQIPHLVTAYYHAQQQMAVNPQLLSPVTGSSSSASPPPGLLEHMSPRQDDLQFLPDIYAPLSAPSSQQHTSGDSAGSPPNALANVFSPVPSAEEPMLEETISENEDDKEQDEYQPTPRRSSVATRTNHGSSSAHAPPKATKPKPKANMETTLPPFDGSSSSKPATVSSGIGNLELVLHPSAPDAEANSEYQGSESGGEFSSDHLEAYAGGPKRERSKGQDSKANRGVGKSNHPYKNFKNMAMQGTGRQMCRYISPYDGWNCEQILARSYDVPRHMEVHAKEEYELVLTGKLPVFQSELFECVTEANVYVCLVCRKDFSRKDAMQRHVRSSSKMSKAKHRAESKASLKKRVLGIPITPHPNAVPKDILQRHRRILEKLKVEAQELGQDVTDWDVENMIPQVGDDSDLFATGPNAPGIPVGRRGGGKPRADEPPPEPVLARPTRATNRPTVAEIERTFEIDQPALPETEPADIALKTPARAPAKAPVRAAVPPPTLEKLHPQPPKPQPIKKATRPSSEVTSFGEGEGVTGAQSIRYRSSHARTRSPAKLDTSATTKQQQLAGPSGVEEVEMEQRDSTESEDEEDTYQEESRRRYTDGEEDNIMEVD
jgi:hypothetical protein